MSFFLEVKKIFTSKSDNSTKVVTESINMDTIRSFRPWLKQPGGKDLRFKEHENITVLYPVNDSGEIYIAEDYVSFQSRSGTIKITG